MHKILIFKLNHLENLWLLLDRHFKFNQLCMRLPLVNITV